MMKRIISLLICILTVFLCSVNSFAETESTSSITVKEGANAQLKPEYSNVNNISITFYVINGRAYVSYVVSSNEDGVTVSVEIEKKTIGFLWSNVGKGKQEKTDKKYLSGSHSVSVNGSGLYRVSVEVKSGKDKISKTSEFEYDENVLLGDANGDGVIRASDARLVLRFAAQLQKYTDKQKKICDIDGNGAVNASDARIVLKAAASLI